MLGKRSVAMFEMLREEEIQVFIGYLMDPRSQLDQPPTCFYPGLLPRRHSSRLTRRLRLVFPTRCSRISAQRQPLVSRTQARILTLYLWFSLSWHRRRIWRRPRPSYQTAYVPSCPFSSQPRSKISTGRIGRSNGIDSLVAVEFRIYFVKNLGTDIPPLVVMGIASTTTLSARITKASKLTAVQIKGAEKLSE